MEYYITAGVGSEDVRILVRNKTKQVKTSSTSIDRFNSICPSVKFVFKFGTTLNLLIAPSNKIIDTRKIFPTKTFPYVEVMIGEIPPKSK